MTERDQEAEWLCAEAAAAQENLFKLSLEAAQQSIDSLTADSIAAQENINSLTAETAVLTADKLGTFRSLNVDKFDLSITILSHSLPSIDSAPEVPELVEEAVCVTSAAPVEEPVMIDEPGNYHYSFINIFIKLQHFTPS